MTDETLARVRVHMQNAEQQLKNARSAVQQAILTMTDKEGINFSFVKDIKNTLDQLTARFSLWEGETVEEE